MPDINLFFFQHVAFEGMQMKISASWRLSIENTADGIDMTSELKSNLTGASVISIPTLYL